MIKNYLDRVLEEKTPASREIIYNLQVKLVVDDKILNKTRKFSTYCRISTLKKLLERSLLRAMI